MNLTRALLAFSLAAATASLAAPASAAHHEAGETLAAAQSAWLAKAEGKPVADAIAALIEDDTRVYVRGGPAQGREKARALLAANPLNQGTATHWKTVKTGLSGDGTHGYSFGYFDVAGVDPKTANRIFLAYWVNRGSGWKVAALKSTLRQPDIAMLDPLPVSRPANAKPGQKPDRAAVEASLKAAEKGFSDRAQEIGVGPAFIEKGREDSINGGRLSARAIGESIGGAGEKSPIYWSADEVLVAPSGDLGITFGFIRPHGAPPPGQPAEAPFFTIWMRDSLDAPWRYVAE